MTSSWVPDRSERREAAGVGLRTGAAQEYDCVAGAHREDSAEDRGMVWQAEGSAGSH